MAETKAGLMDSFKTLQRAQRESAPGSEAWHRATRALHELGERLNACGLTEDEWRFLES